MSIAPQLQRLPEPVRPIVEAARRAVMGAAPSAAEIPYNSEPPRSRSAMWKLARYAVDGKNVVGIGTYATHATLYFYRGRELDDGSGLLEGGGKEMRFVRLRIPADAERPEVERLLRKAFSQPA